MGLFDLCGADFGSSDVVKCLELAGCGGFMLENLGIGFVAMVRGRTAKPLLRC